MAIGGERSIPRRGAAFTSPEGLADTRFRSLRLLMRLAQQAVG